jgi:hypothetical protein
MEATDVTDPSKWPLWARILAGICGLLLTAFNLLPSEVFTRKLTKRERIFCIVFVAFVLSLIMIALSGR